MRLFFILFFIFAYLGLPAVETTPPCAIVFDFGCVIATTDRAQVAEFLAATLGIPKEEAWKKIKCMEDYPKEEEEFEFWKRYAATKGITLPREWFTQFRTVVKNAIVEIPGTMALVLELGRQGYRVGMLSNVTPFKAKLIRQLGYYNFFNPQLLSYKMGVKKPNPQAYKILLDTLQLPPKCVIFIDDKIENVEAAKKMGIDAIQFINAKQLQMQLEERGIKFSLN